MNIKVNGFFKLSDSKNYVILDKHNNEIGTLDVTLEPITAIFSNDEVAFNTKDELENYFNENGYSLTTDSIRWVEYNPNPQDKKTTDCSIRAYCAAEDIKWEDAYDIACQYGRDNAMMPNDGKNCDAILTEHFGYTYHKFRKDEKENNKTVKDFCINHPEGIYVLSVPSHLVTVIDGEYYDSWDSGKKNVKGYYFKDKKKS